MMAGGGKHIQISSQSPACRSRTTCWCSLSCSSSSSNFPFMMSRRCRYTCGSEIISDLVKRSPSRVAQTVESAQERRSSSGSDQDRQSAPRISPFLYHLPGSQPTSYSCA